MKLLLKQVTIVDPLSPFTGQTKDILIIDGNISQIEDSVQADDAEIFEQQGVYVSPGWVDIFSHFNDPGLEMKETLETGAQAAIAGGFTNVFVLPNTKPVISNKASVEYIVQRSKSLPVNIYPLGAITKNAEGNELAEMYDMHNSGAVAFSDGQSPVQVPGLFLKALQYVKAFNGTVIQIPMDKSVGKHGLINEGIISTQLGLPGIPAIAEELIISRDIELAKYTESKLHITGISTAKSLALITVAKKQGISVSCSVTPYHLYYCDEDLVNYSTNLKVDPPLRLREDMLALREGLKNGDIDCVATHHLPQDIDNKLCEFEYAKGGMIGLETCYSVINTILPGLAAETMVKSLSTTPRSLFNLPTATLQKGSIAEITLFDPKLTYTFTLQNIKSRSKNSPFIGQQFKGKAIGIISKDKLYLNK